jgi:hypothetical protein
VAEEGSGEQVESDGKKEKTKEEGGSVPIAVMMLMAVIGGTTLLAMTHTKAAHIGTRTILVVDNVIAIFLAVLWFQGMDDLLDYAIPPQIHYGIVLVHTIIVLALAFAIAWALQSKTSGIAIFCGAGAHYCSFCGRKYALHLQKHHFPATPIICTLGLGVLMIGLGIFLAALYMLKRACGIKPGEESEDEAKNRFMDHFDDLENDFAAMSLASFVVVLTLFWITQQYPEDTEIEPGSHFKHDQHERLAMLLTSLGALVLGAVAMPILEKRKEKGYIKGRLCGVFVSFVCILSVLAFLLFGEMHVYENPSLNATPLFARVLFAGGCSLLAFAGIVILSIRGVTGASVVLVLQSLGLLVGFAWEETFDAAVDIAAEGSGYGHMAKGGIAILCFIAILPSYLSYKPMALQAEKDELEG